MTENDYINPHSFYVSYCYTASYVVSTSIVPFLTSLLSPSLTAPPNMELCLKIADFERFLQLKIGRYEGKNVTL